MAGPYEVVARDGQYARTKNGSERDMKVAHECALLSISAKSDDVKQAYTTKALEIINAYATTLRCFNGHDAPLCTIQGYELVRAMTLLKNASKAKNKAADPTAQGLEAIPETWSGMVRRAILPTLDEFEAHSPYANGNWGAVVNRCRMACAIFLEDSTIYKNAIDYFMYAKDNGAITRYIGPTGQCQETGRDQGHVQLGLGMLCDICEMAWEQGDDLWSAYDNRLLKGIEYTARYNLGYDVPFEKWEDCTGLYNDWTEPGSMGRGKLWDIYRKPYDHYVKHKNLKMPYTKKVLALQEKAHKQGEAQKGRETTITQVPGIMEGKKLHQIFTYPAPVGAPLKHDYEVFIQPRGAKEWTRVDTYMARVNAPIGNNQHKIHDISYTMFDFTGDVFIKVVSKRRKFHQARIRPDYKGVIANVQNDSTVQFILFQPENLSVELDGDITQNLLVFTSKPPVTREEAEREAEKQGRKFVYYPPGYYANQDSLLVSSNTTIYLAGGAYFNSTFAINDASNVSIIGRGIARPTRGYEGAHVSRSKHVLIDGLVVNTCPIGESEHITLHDVRSISHPGWGDGLNVFGGSSHILMDRVFCRNSDDCTTAYATRKGFKGSTRDITMRNSTLWADVAHPIFIGIHGNSERGDTIENLCYENLDILYQSEPQVDYQGCLAINCGDNNLVRDIVFDNIRIEDLHQGCILQVKVAFNTKWCTAPGRGVENITFRNIRYSGQQPYLSIINGYNEERRVRNITFEGLKINGKILYDEMPEKPHWYKTTDYVPMFIGNHVDGVYFKK